MAAVAVTRHGFQTTVPDVANQALCEMYGEVRSWVFGDPDGFTYRLRTGSTPTLATARMRFTMGFGIAAELEPTHHTLLAMIGGDHYTIATRLGESSLRAGDVAVVPGGAALRVSLEALEVITLSVPAADLARTAEEIYGIPSAKFEVLGMDPVSVPALRYLRRMVGLVSNELLTPESALQEPLIFAGIVQALCTAFLGAFPTTGSTMGARGGPGWMAPRTLRRAMEFVDANAHRPLTLNDIAAAAGTSARAVQHAFARYRDTTPMGYVRRVRLERAHGELRAADPTRGDSVAAISARWGFAKPSRFAALYREEFGVNPSHTLRG